MDFLDPRKKRAYKIRLYIGYALMAIALSIGTLILLFEAFGYDINRGEVIQNGLVFVDSRPESARISVNGKYEANTDARFVLPADEEYTIKLERNGYRSWQRTFELEGGAVERLNYPFIFPEKLEPEDAKPYSAQPTFVTQSPDRRWLLVGQPGNLNVLDVINLDNRENPATTITLPDGLLTPAAGEQKLSLVEWSTDNRHLLMSHTFQVGNPAVTSLEFIVIDRQNPAESFNVNRTFNNIALSQVALRDKKFDQLYLLDSNRTLSRGQVASAEITEVAKHVQTFKGYGRDTVLYVTEEGAPVGKALALVRRGQDIYKLRELPKGTLYVADLAQYDGRWFMAVGSDAERQAFVYRNAFDDIARKEPRVPVPIAILRLGQLKHLSFSANARFIGAQGGSEFSVYDAEHDRQYRYDTQLKLPADYKAVWMDGYRYMAVSEDNVVVVFDFDGLNTQTLTASYSGFLPSFDRDYDFLYTLGPSLSNPTHPALLRTSMRIPQDE